MLKLVAFAALLGLSAALPRNRPQPASVLYPHLGNAGIRPSMSKTYGRIVNGEQADEYQFPFIAASLFRVNEETGESVNGYRPNLYFCAASIIDEYTLVTAAHCVSDGDSVEVRAGTIRWRDVDTPEEVAKGAVHIEAERFVPHEDFDFEETLNDIGFVKLKEPLPIGVPNSLGEIPIQTIEMADEEPEVGTEVTIIGWGKVEQFEDVVDVLRWTTSEVVNDGGAVRGKEEQFVCTRTRPTSGTCGGDSGGPIVGPDGKVFGAVSFGNLFCDGDSCFSSIPFYREWLRENADI